VAARRSFDNEEATVKPEEASRRFPISEHWLGRAEACEAWAATRDSIVEDDKFIDGAYPIYASRALGSYVWDVDGSRYVDFILGYGTVILGHASESVTQAVTRELSTGINTSPLWRPLQVELAELLKTTIPGAEMSFFMRTGSDATSGALRLARIFTGRTKVVRWGYNGWHDWCCPRLDGVAPAVRADSLTFRYNDIDSLRHVLEEHADEVACVLMMPFEVEPPRPGFLHDVRDLAHQHGALFILDEMRSGFRIALGGAQGSCPARC
jgi:glutamate-1-semialdehyde aminotransferase